MSDVQTADRQILADAARLAAAAAGDQRTFALLLREEAPRLLRLARLLLGSTAEAEEVVQESFLRLWQAAAAWRPEARIGTWLHRVLHRLCLDRLRRRRPSLDLETILEQPDESRPDPEAEYLAGERDRRLAKALAELPLRQRIAVLLAHHQSLSQAEAAPVMEISQEAYESLLARGRRRLKELLSAGEPSLAGGGKEKQP